MYVCVYVCPFSMHLVRAPECMHTVEMTQTKNGRNPVLFYPTDQIFIGSITCR